MQARRLTTTERYNNSSATYLRTLPSQSAMAAASRGTASLKSIGF